MVFRVQRDSYFLVLLFYWVACACCFFFFVFLGAVISPDQTREVVEAKFGKAMAVFKLKYVSRMERFAKRQMRSSTDRKIRPL